MFQLLPDLQFFDNLVPVESHEVHHKILSEFFEPDGSIASRLRRSAGARPALRDATKSHGSPNETETDLSKNTEFVPIFWTNALISGKLSLADSFSALFASKIHARKGWSQFFPVRPKSSKSFAKETFWFKSSSFFAK